MTNHVHLLLEPPDEVARLGQMMKRLAVLICRSGRTDDRSTQ